jgi:type IV secretion system protein VirD4
MNQVTLAWAAFKNMIRAAWRDPVWALAAIAVAPFAAIRPIFNALALLGIVTLVFGLGGAMALEALGFEQDGLVIQSMKVLLSLVLLILAFRILTNPMILHFGNLGHQTHGSARFATDKEISSLTGSDTGLLLGRDPTSRKLIRYLGFAHLLTIAPTRTGKGVGTIIPNLLTANRSLICVDPKGENARIAARARQAFGPVHVLDPFGVTGKTSSAFNPLDLLDLSSVDIAEDASTLADALVFDEPGMAGEAHWNEEAKALIGGLILRIIGYEELDRRHLGTLRHYLTLPPDAFAALLTTMQQSTEAGGLIARAANRHLGKSDREAAGVLSAAQRHTHFLDSPRMISVLSQSDFRFADLKSRHTTVFLVLPPDRLSTYSRWLRLLITQSLIEMARTSVVPVTEAKPVLYLLDEFASLGYLAPVERAMGLMAGYGVQLWPILQDIHQLRATYGKRAGTFLSNAGVLQVFGVNDHDTARLVSDLLGQETVVFQTVARALDPEQSGLSFSQHHTGRPLLTPDEVRNMAEQNQLLFLAARRPIVAAKLRYYADAEFRGRYDAI